ncbi:RED family protein N-terminal region protein, partial [Toxoplasma gondii GAB2-2007-GAL-DOM2]
TRHHPRRRRNGSRRRRNGCGSAWFRETLGSSETAGARMGSAFCLVCDNEEAPAK